MLVGRNGETAALDRLLEGAREGRSGVLVLRGEPGIGKSALLQYALERARGMTVLRGVGLEAESELAFAALHQILRPVLDRVEGLPEPQAAALRAAFALSDETVDDRFRISLGVLGLLAEAAEERPLLCVVDDVQWLDAPSADALVFAARRLEAEPIAMVFAAREDGPRRFAPSLPELKLEPLATEDARTLVGETIGGDTGSPAVDWVVASANGNPLACIELPASLTAEQIEGREPLDRAMLPTTSVEESYLERVRRLPEATRTLLLLAAAEGSGDRATVMRAAAELALETDELAEAEAAGLVRVAPERIEFRHPLVRSAVYRGAGFAERDRAHLALASALSADADADRRAWHRAAATFGTDDAVAAALEQTADRAKLRAGHTAVSAALERAGELSTDPAERGRRLALAATAADMAGRTARAIALADRAEPLVDDPILRADLAQVRGGAELIVGRPDVASDIFAAAVAVVAPLDPMRAFDLASYALEGAMRGGDPLRTQHAFALGVAIEYDADDPVQAVFAQMFRGVDLFTRGETAAGARVMIDAVAGSDALTDPQHLMWCGVGARHAGNDVLARRLFAQATAEARKTGALKVLVSTLASQAGEAMGAGMLSDAAALADEAVRLADELGAENARAFPLAILAWVDAFHGNADEARRRVDDVLSVAADRGLGLPAATATWTLAGLDLAQGRFDEALDNLVRLSEIRPGFGHPIVALFSTPDRVEAAARAGRPELAQPSMETFDAWVGSTSGGWARPRLERCRGLLAESTEQASAHFAEALELHKETDSPFERARTELVYGELLRRERQRLEARGHLRSALETFEQLGGRHWAERARNELRATGETARRRDPSTIAQLTPQELQIARLVGNGSSNKEVAAQLFLSPRTVEYHLRKVFQKLAISSRAELILHGGEQLGPELSAAAAS